MIGFIQVYSSSIWLVSSRSTPQSISQAKPTPLCNDLRLLAAFVKDITESRSKHAVVKELVRRIRIEVYKAEDIVDMLVVRASVQKSRTSLEKAFHVTDYPIKLRSVGKEIQVIRRRLKDIYDNKLFGYEALGMRESVTRSPPAVEEDNVVGFDKEAEKMVGWGGSTIFFTWVVSYSAFSSKTHLALPPN